MLPRAVTAAAPMLDVRGLSKHFGGVQALDSVTLAGLAGEVHGLVGPNGAGKSTLIGCITGLLGIDGGEIVFQGRRIDRSPPHLRARLGIARTFQKIRLAQPLTVFENVAIGCAAGRFGRSLERSADARAALVGSDRRACRWRAPDRRHFGSAE